MIYIDRVNFFVLGKYVIICKLYNFIKENQSLLLSWLFSICITVLIQWPLGYTIAMAQTVYQIAVRFLLQLTGQLVKIF